MLRVQALACVFAKAQPKKGCTLYASCHGEHYYPMSPSLRRLTHVILRLSAPQYLRSKGIKSNSRSRSVILISSEKFLK